MLSVVGSVLAAVFFVYGICLSIILPHVHSTNRKFPWEAPRMRDGVVRYNDQKAALLFILRPPTRDRTLLVVCAIGRVALVTWIPCAAIFVLLLAVTFVFR